jgi:hypothetical protein
MSEDGVDVDDGVTVTATTNNHRVFGKLPLRLRVIKIAHDQSPSLARTDTIRVERLITRRSLTSRHGSRRTVACASSRQSPTRKDQAHG